MNGYLHTAMMMIDIWWSIDQDHDQLINLKMIASLDWFRCFFLLLPPPVKKVRIWIFEKWNFCLKKEIQVANPKSKMMTDILLKGENWLHWRSIHMGKKKKDFFVCLKTNKYWHRMFLLPQTNKYRLYYYRFYRIITIVIIRRVVRCFFFVVLFCFGRRNSSIFFSRSINQSINRW